jgi:tetratricopeptide (TPR) repeat protein
MNRYSHFPISGLRNSLLFAVLLAEAACVGGGRQTRPVFAPYPETSAKAPNPASKSGAPTPPPVQVRPLPESPGELTPIPPPAGGATGAGAAPGSAPPAVIALESEAAASLESGDLDSAASSLERAIRIQPRNPQLWHDLAVVRFRQDQPGLAEDLAKKSNLHAQGNPELIRANWTLIAEARDKKGDSEGAADARDKAGQQ